MSLVRSVDGCGDVDHGRSVARAGKQRVMTGGLAGWWFCRVSSIVGGSEVLRQEQLWMAQQMQVDGLGTCLMARLASVCVVDGRA